MNSEEKKTETSKFEEIDLEKSLKELEGMVDRLESGNIGLEEAFKLFEEGSRLSEKINHKIGSYERKLQILNEQYRLQDFEGDIKENNEEV